LLTEISVKNIAVLQDVKIHFREGLNVITGETGAGKSILIESLKLALGEKVSQTLVPDAEEGVVEIVYDIMGDEETTYSLESAGLPQSDSLIMRRKVTPLGRSRIYVNESPATGQFVAEITSELVSILGQHGYQRLFGSRNATKLLDAFCGNIPLYKDFLRAYRNWRKVIREMELLRAEAPNIAGRVEWLDACIGELAAVDIQPGEEAKIEEELPVLKNAARIREAIRESVDVIDQNEDSSISRLKRGVDSLGSVSRFDPSLNEITAKLEEHMHALTDISRDLMTRFSEIDIDEERYQTLVERLSLLRRLSRKYDVMPDGLPGKVDALRKERKELQGSVEKLNHLTASEETLREETLSHARLLSEKRRQGASAFEGSVLRELAELGLSEALFQLVFTDYDEAGLSSYGLERVDISFSPSTSFEGGPLVQVASGGELSRIMLAVHNTVAGRERFRTLIFDEVDAGIGGSMAEVIGEKLKKISGSAQVICITHLPQIAALADHHIKIVKVKSENGDRTVAKSLARKERIDEIARMVSGERVTDAAKKYAANLLKRG
jgi:DNA repair protein RecN (Recombination protein N)